MKRPDERIQLSTRRLWVAGRTAELYEYGRPYSYNWPPERRSADCTAETRPEPGRGSRRDDNLHRARARLRRLVAANEGAWGQVPKFVTYTFAENVTEYATAVGVWRQYSRRLSTVFGPQKYLTVVEYQKRGAVHFHTLHFSLPFVPGIKERLARMWGKGHVKVVAIRHVRSVSNYVSKYIPKEIFDSRLVRRKAFFCSRGLVKPTELRSSVKIDAFLAGNRMEEEFSVAFDGGRMGSVDYKILKVLK